MLRTSTEHYTPEELDELRADFHSLFSKFPIEVIQQVREKVVSGVIEGEYYFRSGYRKQLPCGCIKGWMAELLHPRMSRLFKFYSVPRQATAIHNVFVAHSIPDVSVHDREDDERFVYHIHFGDTPETSEHSAWLLETIDSYLLKRKESEDGLQ